MKKTMSPAETDQPKELKHLQVIADTKIGVLTDDQVLGLLAERKRLTEWKLRDEEARQALAIARKQKEERMTLEVSLATLNQSITPDKPDAELLALIKERQQIEAEIESIERDSSEVDPDMTSATESLPENPMTVVNGERVTEVSVKQVDDKEAEAEQRGETGEEAVEHLTEKPTKERAEGEQSEYRETREASSVLEPISADETTESRAESEPPVIPDSVSVSSLDLKDNFGRETIEKDDLGTNNEFGRFLEQLRSSTSSLGTILQDMPAEAKRNKAFMLKVAEIDPAFAIHYADPVVLKKDDDFNARVAAMKNHRQSGEPLTEMSPEMRTNRVVLAAVNRNYLNIRFANAGMSDYEKMLEIAKKSAIEKIKNLKDATDVAMLIPRALQKNRLFMNEVEKITHPSQSDSHPDRTAAIAVPVTDEAEGSSVSKTTQDDLGKRPSASSWHIRPSDT